MLGWPVGDSSEHFIDVRGPSTLWAAPFPRQRVLNLSKSRETELGTALDSQA